jgi:hypothetical protein
MIRVYAFVDRLARLPTVRGVAGAPLEQHGTDVVAIVSRDIVSHRDPRQEAVEHGLAVEALAAVAPAVVPVRFGETFADDDALEAALRDRLDEIRDALARVRGCVEIGVRVTGTALQRRRAVAASGTGYMQARLAALTERDAIAHGLHEQLAALSRAALHSERGGFEASYLVERAQLDDMQARVRSFAKAHPALAVTCTGPWAPYSFGGAG